MYSRHSGYEDWLLVRVSAVVMALYLAVLQGCWFFAEKALSRAEWVAFLLSPTMKVLGVLAVAAMLVHAIIGVWVIMTDYIKIDWLQYVLLALFYIIVTFSSVAILLIFLQY